MPFIKKPSVKFFIACISLSSLMTTPCLSQSNTDYLKLLEGEASNSSVDKKTQANSKKKSTIKSVTSYSNGKITPGLSLDDFMKNLKVNYIGTYYFAKRLSDNQTNEIYSFYQTNNDPQAIRTKIIEISKKN